MLFSYNFETLILESHIWNRKKLYNQSARAHQWYHHGLKTFRHPSHYLTSLLLCPTNRVGSISWIWISRQFYDCSFWYLSTYLLTINCNIFCRERTEKYTVSAWLQPHSWIEPKEIEKNCFCGFSWINPHFLVKKSTFEI